jgi:hypothetical protein
MKLMYRTVSLVRVLVVKKEVQICENDKSRKQNMEDVLTGIES